MSQIAEGRVHKVGFITPPAWFDISPTEFLGLAPADVIVTQTLMRPPQFDYAPESIRAAVPELLECARSLAAAGADVIGQFGFPFSFAHGWEGAQAVRRRIEDEAEVPFVMMGVQVVHALRALDCASVVVASTYYSHRMETLLTSYLREAGIEVAHIENWQSQGIVDASNGGVFVGQGELDPMGWKTPGWAVAEAVRHVAAHSSIGSCILVTGGGMRLLHIVASLERELDRTIVAGDLSLYWGILRRLGHSSPVTNHGKLLAGLGESNSLQP